MTTYTGHMSPFGSVSEILLPSGGTEGHKVDQVLAGNDAQCMKTHPSPVINLQCSLLCTQDHMAGSLVCSQACGEKSVELVLVVILCLTASLLPVSARTCIAAEKLFFIVLFHHRPTSAGVTSLFWKGLFHIRILMLQPSLLHVLVLGWFCGSVGYPLILLKDLTLLPARDFLHRKGKKHF